MRYEVEIRDHGVDGASYFPGAGVAFTCFTDCVTGCGDTLAEALDDAQENAAGVEMAEGDKSAEGSLT